MERLKFIKVKQSSGKYGDAIPIGAEATNIDIYTYEDKDKNNNFIHNLQQTVGEIYVNKEPQDQSYPYMRGSIADQLQQIDTRLKEDKLQLEAEKNKRQTQDKILDDKISDLNDRLDALQSGNDDANENLEKRVTILENTASQHESQLNDHQDRITALEQGGFGNGSDSNIIYSGGTGITIDTSNKINHTNSVLPALPTQTDATLTPGEAFKVPYYTYDNEGHITAMKSITFSVPTSFGSGSGQQNHINIVQTTGQSTTDVMSQKAVTDALANINIGDGGENNSPSTDNIEKFTSFDSINGIVIQDNNISINAQGSIYNNKNWQYHNFQHDFAIPIVATNDIKPVLQSDKKTVGFELTDNFKNNYILKNAIVQTTGQSTTDVMSQKAVTDELGKIIEYIELEYSGSDSSIGEFSLTKTNTGRVDFWFKKRLSDISSTFNSGANNTFVMSALLNLPYLPNYERIFKSVDFSLVSLDLLESNPVLVTCGIHVSNDSGGTPTAVDLKISAITKPSTNSYVVGYIRGKKY